MFRLGIDTWQGQAGQRVEVAVVRRDIEGNSVGRATLVHIAPKLLPALARESDGGGCLLTGNAQPGCFLVQILSKRTVRSILREIHLNGGRTIGEMHAAVSLVSANLPGLRVMQREAQRGILVDLCWLNRLVGNALIVLI